ncbi:MAG TPA: hypothetical protein PLG20_00575 [Candidatus Syntrophosphaera sp.]|jgi:hypothetical protein|nr:hypothetical protein [Candidatus Syntrophosphaera sp.]
MLKNQRGNALFWVISAILAIALIFILALSGSFNLDPEKNVDDCTTNMKNIWVAANDYMLDTQKDFTGDLNVLRKTMRPNGKGAYLSDEKYCPESQGRKDAYLVFGKHATEMFEGELRHYNGIIVLCPNLDKFPKHILEKSFYDNMSITKLQTVMMNDMAKIDAFTKSNSKLKAEYLQKYLDFWKKTPNVDFQACISDPAYQAMRTEVTGEKATTETEEETQ